MQRVLVISEAGGVSEFYRTLTPYRLLASAGLIELSIDEGHNPALIDHLDKFDTVVFSRSDSAEHSLILLHSKLRGLHVVFDIDDNLLLIPPSMGAFNVWHVRGTGQITARAYYLKRNIQAADVLTVSTEALGRQLCDGEPYRLRGDYRHLPNHILEAEWRDVCPLEKPAGQLWVGWWGIYNHWDDWRDVAPVIEPVLAERPETRLLLLGMPELAQLFPRLQAQGQLITAPFVSTEELGPYRAMLKSLDVALAPTCAHPFNEAKSDLKLLQYGAAGVAAIGSKTTYAGWENEAAIVDTPAHFGVALEHLLTDESARRESAARLQARVLAERTYEQRYLDWLEVFE